MTEKLRPCPFCGGEAKLQLTDDEGNFKDESYLEDPCTWVNFCTTGVGISTQHGLGYEYLSNELIEAISQQMKELGQINEK